MGMNVEIKANADPIIQATPKAINRVFKLIFPKYVAKTERLIALSQAQTREDVNKIEKGESYYDLESHQLKKENISHYTSLDLIKDIVSDEEATNLLRCSLYASSYLEEDINNDLSVDKTFINRWRNEAKNFESNDVQEMWGRILAEKVKDNDYINLRTLDVLKNISSYEATIFDEICEYVVFKDKIFDIGIDAEKLNVLSEIGLIHRSQGSMKTGGGWPSGKGIVYISRGSDLYWVSGKDLKKDELLFLENNNYLTTAGKTLYDISMRSKNFDIKNFAMGLMKVSGNSLQYINHVKIDDSGSCNLEHSTRISI